MSLYVCSSRKVRDTKVAAPSWVWSNPQRAFGPERGQDHGNGTSTYRYHGQNKGGRDDLVVPGSRYARVENYGPGDRRWTYIGVITEVVTRRAQPLPRVFDITVDTAVVNAGMKASDCDTAARLELLHQVTGLNVRIYTKKTGVVEPDLTRMRDGDQPRYPIATQQGMMFLAVDGENNGAGGGDGDAAAARAADDADDTAAVDDADVAAAADDADVADAADDADGAAPRAADDIEGKEDDVIVIDNSRDQHIAKRNRTE